MPSNVYQSRTDSAADRITAFADKIADGAADAQSKISSFGRQAADAIDDNINAATAFVREHDGSRMMRDLKRVVRNNPGPSLIAAIAVGFIAGSVITRRTRS
jgi:ElaB/YqjD/DUF883 family membrane-anchored ribosome-binding protein